MPHKLVVITIVKPTDATLIDVAGKEELPYSQFLKKLWVYWKANKLTHTEKVKS